MECFQWNDTEFNIEDVKEELFDIMIPQALNVDIIDIINDKMDKTEKKYSVDKVKGISLKYNKL